MELGQLFYVAASFPNRSTGVIAYVLLSGLSPFLGDSDAETWANVTRADPVTFDDDSVSDTVTL